MGLEEDAPIVESETGELFAVFLKDGKKVLKPFKPGGARPAAKASARKGETRKCFRCDRKGHLAAQCTFPTKPDGTPSNPHRPKDAQFLEEAPKEAEPEDCGLLEINGFDVVRKNSKQQFPFGFDDHWEGDSEGDMVIGPMIGLKL